MSLQAPSWEHHALKLHMEHFTSHSVGFHPPIGPLFPQLGNRLLSQGGPGWGLVYTASPTVDGFTGYVDRCICTEQYMLSKADHPEAQQVSVFLCRHQFLLCAGTNIFGAVLCNQPRNCSSLKLTQLESGDKIICPLICFTAQLLVLVLREGMMRVGMSSRG